MDRDRFEQGDVVGEIPGAKYHFTAGHNPGVLASGEWCGTPEDFAGEGRPPVLPNGRPDFSRLCGCSYRPTLGFGIRRWKRYRAKLGLSGGSVLPVSSPSGAASLALSGGSILPVSLDGFGSIALDGSSTAPYLEGTAYGGRRGLLEMFSGSTTYEFIG